MTMSEDDSQLPHNLEVEVEAELALAESSGLDDGLGMSPAEWLFDPLDVEREEVGLRSLLGAVEAIEGDSQSLRSLDVAPRAGQPD
jgi:hypothetical protein